MMISSAPKPVMSLPTAVAVAAHGGADMVDGALIEDRPWEKQLVLMRVGERKYRNVIINLPPHHMKSALASILYPALAWRAHDLAGLSGQVVRQVVAVRDADELDGRIASKPPSVAISSR